MHSGMAAIRALMLPGLCHADACKANVTGFLRAHSTAHQGPASDLDALEGHGSCEGALPGLSELKRLQASVLALSASESLHLLGAELLAQVIDVLAGYMRQGQSVVLDLVSQARELLPLLMCACLLTDNIKGQALHGSPRPQQWS